MSAGTVIIGAGQAGFETAGSLREQGYQERVTLIGDEPHLPYQRPPLSKGFVLGTQGLDQVELRPASFYADHRIDLLAGERVAAVDRAEHRVRLASGTSIPYASLVLAVGARNRRLGIEGAGLDGVLSLRTLDESIAIKERLQGAREVVVIGGGFIGLEVAAVARALGKSVTVLELQPRLMPRVVAPEISDFYQTVHTSRGVTVRCGAGVRRIAGNGGPARAVVLDDGTSYPTDLVLVGIGVVPNTQLAQLAGLPVANGIVVDEHLQTPDPAVYAVGDCAEHPSVFAYANAAAGLGIPAGTEGRREIGSGERATGTARRRIRLESVQNASDQGRSVAATIAGRRSPYGALPWFWTDQFDVRLQMAGLSQGYDRQVIRGDRAGGKFSIFYFAEGQLLAVDSVNRPVDHIIARKLLSVRAPIAPEQAADESVDLRKLTGKS